MKTCYFSVTEYVRTCWYKCLDQQALMQPMAAQLATEFINRSVLMASLIYATVVAFYILSSVTLKTSSTRV